MQHNPAINPAISATVSASAGTGKTWSLVSRLIRLLMDGSEAGSILAITFTRKAAAEMQSRLNERLLELASCSETQLKSNLELIGCPVTADSLATARQLYERILYSSHPPRITTFHAMCQELLKRFPFDANVPPGFELTEQTADLESEARDLLFNEATLNNQGKIAGALETLFFYCGGLDNTQTALNNFLQHRSDWWAFTRNQRDPVAYATDNLKNLLKIETFNDPLDAFFSQDILVRLNEFTDLLARHPVKTNQEAIENINLVVTQVNSQQFSVAFENLSKAFFTTTGGPRSRKPSGVQKSKMGEDGEQRFLELHGLFVKKIQLVKEQQAKLNTFKLSSAWYTAGNQLLNHYQTIKTEQRVLDFADLEWNAFLLLSDETHASWIQYKLDSRIDHVLIDEYQDTNPTQWHLLRPLLEEICSTNTDRNRSIFIVGDTKQSIYRFRRAQPRLFDIARQWMNQRIETVNSSLDLSRRSSPAIINFVNMVFDDGPLNEHIVNFESHTTHLKDLWGKVVIPPLFVDDLQSETPEEDDSQQSTEFRNPLLTPLKIPEDQRRISEAKYIADEIFNLISANTIIGSEGNERYLNYSDIIILLGQRTHAGVYQKELNARDIPYIGINKGTLLETLEIRDLSALLNLLITPFDNLALAQVLKSPIFDCDDKDLIALASLKKGDWLERLTSLAEQKPEQRSLNRAIRLLSSWKSDIGKLPVHDLLDKIVSESNLINRYIAAYPGHLKNSVESNLNRFIELALEVDSGRYPSIARFLQRLSSLRNNQKDAPDELPAGKNTDRVRLMTIHAAKGLEAPVIFLADANSTAQNREAYQAVINWPAEAEKPDCFLLSPRKEDQDQTVVDIFNAQSNDVQREQTNLLYVALTRAKQLLYVTGSQSRKEGRNLKWLDTIRSQLEKHSDKVQPANDGSIVISSHKMPDKITSTPKPAPIAVLPEIPQLSKPLTDSFQELTITPSSLIRTPGNQPVNYPQANSNSNAQQRGIIIHKMLQLLTESHDRQKTKQLIDSLYQGQANSQLLEQCWSEANDLIDSSNFSFLFDETSYDAAYNEVPVQYRQDRHNLHGIVDRLVVNKEQVYVVDYKTAKISGDSLTRENLQSYSTQMSVYYHGVRNLWPDKTVISKVIFTHNQTAIDIEPVPLDQLLCSAQP